MKPADGHKRAVGRSIHQNNQLRAFANEEARRERDAARKRKKASKGGGHDVFGSNARREQQAQKDAHELSRPVRSVFSAGTGFLNLRAYAKKTESDVDGVKQAAKDIGKN